MSLKAKQFLNSINFKYWWLHPYKNSVSELMQQYADAENSDLKNRLKISETASIGTLERISELMNSLQGWQKLAAIHPDPLKWLETYKDYQELLIKEDVAAWWQSAFEICNEERKKLKNDLPRP